MSMHEHTCSYTFHMLIKSPPILTERERLYRLLKGTLLVYVPLKLYLSFLVMNNDSNAFSHQLMTTFVLIQLH
jgi:hypothetical protein